MKLATDSECTQRSTGARGWAEIPGFRRFFFAWIESWKCHNFRVSERYLIKRNVDGTFAVLVIGPEARLAGASGFTTKADAKAWVDEKKRIAAGGRPAVDGGFGRVASTRAKRARRPIR